MSEELEARALRLLEHAKEVEPRDIVRRYGSLLRLWRFPAYGVQTTWTILAPGRKAPPGAPMLVREIVWDRPTDEQRGGTEPSIRLRESMILEEHLQRLLAGGRELMVPVVGVASPMGLDGEHFGLETYTVSPSVRVQWWNAGPTEWRHFIDWVAELRAFLQSCLDQTG
jgi:hypothetical protein